MNCCSNCFNDNFLAEQIAELSQDIGNCDYCKMENITIINPTSLKNYFSLLIELYEVSENGDFLIDLLKKDWFIFISINDNEISKNLIEDILDIGINNKYAPKNLDDSNILNWEDFKNELKYNNRYFPKTAPNYEHLKTLLGYLRPTNSYEYLYRARINKEEKDIGLKDMGKPHPSKSTAGRANPIGIPYLYTASDITTAIAEVRPHKGDCITIAKFRVTSHLKLADLRNPRQLISPFMWDEDGLSQIFSDLKYLCYLGEELTKPILPREAQLEYLSTQYLCELIKHCGFDGVIYKSSVGDGDNFAIFDDVKLKAIEKEVYQINNLEFDFSKL